MDKVVDEIVEENVVQILTDNEATLKAAGELLIDERKHLYWTPCVTHCIDLILKDIGKIDKVRETIKRLEKLHHSSIRV